MSSRCDPQGLPHAEESALLIDMARPRAPIDCRDGAAFVGILNKDAERINAVIKRIGKVE